MQIKFEGKNCQITATGNYFIRHFIIMPSMEQTSIFVSFDIFSRSWNTFYINLAFSKTNILNQIFITSYLYILDINKISKLAKYDTYTYQNLILPTRCKCINQQKLVFVFRKIGYHISYHFYDMP